MSISQGNVVVCPDSSPCAPRIRAARSWASSPAPWPFFGPDSNSPAWRAGLRNSDVIVAVHGEGRQERPRFLVWFRQRYDSGAEVAFTVAGAGG